jgi:hypothetical protein
LGNIGSKNRPSHEIVGDVASYMRRQLRTSFDHLDLVWRRRWKVEEGSSSQGAKILALALLVSSHCVRLLSEKDVSCDSPPLLMNGEAPSARVWISRAQFGGRVPAARV